MPLILNRAARFPQYHEPGFQCVERTGLARPRGPTERQKTGYIGSQFLLDPGGTARFALPFNANAALLINFR